MRPLRALAALWMLPFAVLGCPTEPEARVKDAPTAEDEWSRFPTSKEWLFATSDFNGAHKAECEHVLGWIKGESTCKGQLCEHGRDLASEWLKRCSSLSEEGVVAEAKRVQADLASRAGEPETDCSKSFETLARDGCAAATCLSRAQRWSTRCAKSEGSPLLVLILQKVIDRRAEPGSERVELDPRSCDDLRVDVMEAAKCKDRFACQEAIPKVESFRDRCETDGDKPTIGTAVAEMTVLAAGGKAPASIPTRQGSPGVAPGDVPVALHDGSGGVISVCDERASDLKRYVEARKTCQGGKMMVACAFSTTNGAEVRVGALDFPNDGIFSARYPTILSVGEVELRDRATAAAIGTDLAKAVELSKTPRGAAEAAKIVARAVVTNALAVKRSPLVKTELQSRDGDLAPALKELARAKVAAARGLKVSAVETAGMLARARTRAFADVTEDGTVQPGAPGRTFTLSTTALLPQAMEAYTKALGSPRGGHLPSRLAAAEKARGLQAAEACGSWEKKLQEIKKALVSCNFGITTCDASKLSQLAQSVDQARTSAESAFHEMESARTADADDADAIQRASEGAGCREPWW